ncbi:MAG: 4Fe-4S dicluster domain-containing protein, partial [Desulfonatronovibrio sp.]
EYYDPRVAGYESIDACAGQCSSCGSCMDCGLCDALCPTGAIVRKDTGKGSFERSADPERCIGCGFCEGCCPCGIWALKENFPMG